MKKLFFSTIILLLTGIQHLSAQTFTIGPKVGLNLSRIRGLENNEIRPGTAAGLSIAWEKCTNVGFNAELLISSKGTRIIRHLRTDSVSEKWDNYANLVYLEAPLLLNVFIVNKDHSFRPKLFGGSSVAYMLSASESINYTKDRTNGEYIKTYSSHDISGNYKNVDFGVILGLGFNYRMSPKTYFTFDTRYSAGLANIQTDSKSASLYNRNISLLLGVTYQISK